MTDSEQIKTDLTDSIRQQANVAAKGAQKAFDTYVEAASSSLRRSQEVAAKGYEVWAEAWSGNALPKLPLPRLGSSADLRAAVDVSFDFAQGVLDAQRELVTHLVEAIPTGRS